MPKVMHAHKRKMKLWRGRRGSAHADTKHDHACPSCGYIHSDLNHGDVEAINRIKDHVARTRSIEATYAGYWCEEYGS